MSVEYRDGSAAHLVVHEETAEEMFLSPKTVEGYLARARTKLGLHTRREIVRFALEAGLLKRDEDPGSDA